MKMNTSSDFKCNECGFVHGRVERNLDGSIKLIVCQPFVKIIVFEERTGDILLKCPKCGNEDRVGLKVHK